MKDKPRFELQPSRATLHMCDRCGKTDTDTMIDGQLGPMWTDNDNGETVCGPCKNEREASTEPKPVDKPRNRNRVYLAGPMTGIYDYNYPAFHCAAAEYRALGFDVVSPAEIHGNDFGKTFDEYLAADLAALETCGLIILLEGWEHSRGAKIELVHALAFNLAVEVADTPADGYKAALESIATCPVCEQPAVCTDDCHFAKDSIENEDTAAYDMMYAARVALAGGQAVGYEALKKGG